MARNAEIQIIIKAVDRASRTLGGVGNAFRKLGQVGLIAAGAVTAVGIGMAAAAYKLATHAAQVDQVENTYNNLLASLGETTSGIESMREATRGMVNDYDLMRNANLLMSMGLADTNEEAAALSEMATQLGMAMGHDATQSMEDFALMLSNQSIPRLDTFGISSANVRARIEELMAADAGLSRETAFMTAVTEQGAIAMQRIGEQGGGAAGSMARLQSNIENLKTRIGQAFLPLLATVSEKLVTAFQSPEIQAAINDKLIPWIEKIVGDENSGIIGIITYLGEGNVENAFDIAFGQGAYQKLQNFLTDFREFKDDIVEICNTISNVIAGIQQAFAGANSQYSNWMNNYQNWQQTGSQFQNWGGGYARGGSFTVPGSGSGDRPFTLGLTPGEHVNIAPKGRVVGGQLVALTVNINTPINLADRAFAERELMPYIESGVRQLLARGA